MFICDYYYFFFFKQKTAYEMRISDWSSDVCSSDLCRRCPAKAKPPARRPRAPRPASANPPQSTPLVANSPKAAGVSVVSVRPNRWRNPKPSAEIPPSCPVPRLQAGHDSRRVRFVSREADPVLVWRRYFSNLLKLPYLVYADYSAWRSEGQTC